MTIQGTGFAPQQSDNRVYFDGMLADIVSAAPTRLVVDPRHAYVESEREMQVTVVSSNRVSNSHRWKAMPSGSAEPYPGAYLTSPRDMALSADGSTVWVADSRVGLIEIDVSSGRSRSVSPKASPLHRPTAVAVHPSTGEIFVADDVSESGNGSRNRIVALTPGDVVTYRTVLGSIQNQRPIQAMVFDAAENLYVISQHTNTRIGMLRPDGTWQGSWAVIEVEDLAPQGAVILGSDIFMSASGTAAVRGIYRVMLSTGANEKLQLSSLPLSIRGIAVDAQALLLRLVTEEGIVSVSPIGSPAQVLPYSSFQLPSVADRVPLVRAPDGSHLWLGRAGQNQSLWLSNDPDHYEPVITSIQSLGQSQLLARGNEIYWSDYSEAGGVMRMGPDGVVERVTSKGRAYCMAFAPNGSLVVADRRDRALYSVNTVTGAASLVLSLEDEVEDLYCTAVTSGGDLLVSYRPEEGGISWLKTSMTGAEPTMDWKSGLSRGGVIFDGSLVGAAAAGIHRWDLSDDSPEPSLWIPSSVTSVVSGFALGREGTLLAAAPLNDGLLEILPDGHVWTIRQPADPGPPINAPSALAQLANGDIIVFDVASASLYRVLP